MIPDVQTGMSRLAIKGVIGRKIKDWVANIDDDKVKKVVEENTVVTGGCIASMLLGEPVKDFDIYMRTREAAEVVVHYLVDKFMEDPPARYKVDKDQANAIVVIALDDRIKIGIKSSGVATVDSETSPDNAAMPPPNYQYFENPDVPDADREAFLDKVTEVVSDGVKEKKTRKPYSPIFLTTNAITLSNKVQVVTRFFGEPDEIHASYDFLHCMNYWTSWNQELVLRPAALESLLSRQLIYNGSKYPICSVLRARKFINRGWRIGSGQYLKMLFQINELDLNNLSVLEEQLTGVDFAYFRQLLDVITEERKANNALNIDATYICGLIDRVFT